MLKRTQSETVQPRRFHRVSLAVLLFSFLLVASSAAQVLYRVQLPTEGWTYDAGEDFAANQILFKTNLLGDPTPIQPGDSFLALEGIPLNQEGLPNPPVADGWQVGQVAHYTVQRGGATLVLDVPLKRWTAAGIASFAFSRGGWAVWLAFVLMVAIGLFVLLKRPETPSARALLLFSTVLLVNQISSGLVPDGPTTQYSAVYRFTAFFSNWIWVILLTPTLFALSLTFPHPKRVLRRFPWLLVLPYTVFWALTALFGLKAEIGYGLSGVFFVLSLVSIIHSVFTQRDAVSRAQLLWGLGGLLVALLCYMPMYLAVFQTLAGTTATSNSLFDALSNFGFPAFTAGLGVAILRYRLFDIEVIIRRTLVYTVVTALLALVYFGGVVVLQNTFEALTGQTSPLAVVASTLAIAALFTPLRRRVQDIVDRRFYRRRYNAEQVLAQFAATVRDEVELSQLTDQLLTVVEETMEPAQIGLWLRQSGKQGS